MQAPSRPFELPEAIRFDNAATVRAAGERFLEDAPQSARISLAALAESNSVTVAVLLGWVRKARALARTLEFVDVPVGLRNIIELYGVTSVLPLENGVSVQAWHAGATAGDPGSEPQQEQQ